MKLLGDLEIAGKRVFVRADLDVPLREAQVSKDERPFGFAQGELTTNAEIATRLTNLKPTVDYLIENGASKVIIAGHIDRPSPRLQNGKPVIDPALSTKQLLKSLSTILNHEIVFVGNLDEVSPRRYEERPRSSSSRIILLENLRFWKGETENDLEFAKKLASFADCYVNEAFGNSHREHASMVALPSLFADVKDLLEPEGSAEPERPEGFYPRRAAGIHLEKEVEVLSNLLKNPERPFVAIVGGAKIETKVPVIANFAKIADQVLVGGELPLEIAKSGMEFPPNVSIGKLTIDGKELSRESVNQFIEKIKGAKTIIWNGPTGVFEEGFESCTLAIAQAILESGAYSIVGGGETTQFLGSKNLLSRFSFVSAGGGAMLEFLAGKDLPGIKALE